MFLLLVRLLPSRQTNNAGAIWELAQFPTLIHESMRYVLEQRIRTANVNIGEFPERHISMNNGPVTISFKKGGW